MLQGSCLCGSIRYEITGELGPIIYCYCSQCRKASGSSCATNATVAAEEFRFVAGADLVGEFESSPDTFRCFCTRCGSPLVKRYKDNPEQIRLRLGTLESDPEAEVTAHIFVGSKASWTRITDDLPQHA